MEYKLIAKGGFESTAKFEKRLNALSAQGWRVITSMTQGAFLVLGKEKH
ncbi:hypothetical protein [Roseivirga sp.]